MKSKQNHLPLFGPGPFFGVTVIALTVLLKQTEEKWLSDLYGEERHVARTTSRFYADLLEIQRSG